MQQITEKEKLKVSTALNHINRYFVYSHQKKITIKEVAKETGISREQLSRLSTDSKFSTIYNIAAAILYCVYERSYDAAERLNVLFIITLMAENETFFL